MERYELRQEYYLQDGRGPSVVLGDTRGEEIGIWDRPRAIIKLVDDMTANQPLTLAQIFSWMAGADIVENTRCGYKRVSRLLVRARARGWLDSRRIKEGRVSHWPPKFSPGDKVVLVTARCPKALMAGLRVSNPRTIVALGRYDHDHPCYFVGYNRLGTEDVSAYPFRSFQLALWERKGRPGRPKLKRHYNRKNDATGICPTAGDERGRCR